MGMHVNMCRRVLRVALELHIHHTCPSFAPSCGVHWVASWRQLMLADLRPIIVVSQHRRQHRSAELRHTRYLRHLESEFFPCRSVLHSEADSAKDISLRMLFQRTMYSLDHSHRRVVFTGRHPGDI